jgi:hypothetical protein
MHVFLFYYLQFVGTRRDAGTRNLCQKRRASGASWTPFVTSIQPTTLSMALTQLPPCRAYQESTFCGWLVQAGASCANTANWRTRESSLVSPRKYHRRTYHPERYRFELSIYFRAPTCSLFRWFGPPRLTFDCFYLFFLCWYLLVFL